MSRSSEERAPARAPLNRARVLAAALELADAEGAAALSMRRLAERLGVVPMALYKHVSDKEDLLEGLIDAVIAEFAEPTGGPPETWDEEVKRRVLAARAVMERHRWARRLMETRTRRTPTVLRHMELVTSAFLRGGLSADLTHHAMHTLGNRIWGFSPELFNDPGDLDGTAPRPRRVLPEPDPSVLPGILAVASDAAARRPGAVGCDEEFEFGFALRLILDGVAALHQSGWQSSGGGATANNLTPNRVLASPDAL